MANRDHDQNNEDKIAYPKAEDCNNKRIPPKTEKKPIEKKGGYERLKLTKTTQKSLLLSVDSEKELNNKCKRKKLYITEKNNEISNPSQSPINLPNFGQTQEEASQKQFDERNKYSSSLDSHQ